MTPIAVGAAIRYLILLSVINFILFYRSLGRQKAHMDDKKLRARNGRFRVMIISSDAGFSLASVFSSKNRSRVWFTLSSSFCVTNVAQNKFH